MASLYKKARVVIYRHYRFLDKDPVIDRLRTMMHDEGLNEHKSAMISGLAPGTLMNWFRGETRRPQFASIKAFSGALGYDMTFVKFRIGELDVKAEAKATAAWKTAKKDKMREFKW
jgi:transcriptional regulator with XRE-family HTH domain